MIWYKKILTWFLIGLLISQEIFRIPYSISAAKALEIDSHENIISLIVEEKLFEKMQNDIEKYALRVQSVLPRTRTVILTFSEDSHPFLIAAANERLYYSGIPEHGNKTQKLIGTILIGNIPLPTVYKDAKSFLSIFPYVDFEEPNFTWTWDKGRYTYLATERKNPRPEIWHSVIAPHTGDIVQDVEKIKDFFNRVYQYDNKTGPYQNLGKDPQVLYVDTVRDSRATSAWSLAAYEQLFVPNQENFRYNRYTKDFAKYLYESYLSLMKWNGLAEISSFSDWRPKTQENKTSSLTIDTLEKASLWSTSFLSSASDISTRIFARELVPGFVKTLSEKYIGDISRWVHQSGRYYDWYSKVRVDTMPELIQKRDAISSQVLREINDSLEKIVDDYVIGSLSIDIPVLVSRNKSAQSENFIYTNYFFGKKASSIKDASECSLLRWSSFGSTNTVAEMNHWYHVQWIQDDVDLITKDGQSRIRCDDRVTTYWGGNTPMNLDLSSWLAKLKTHKYDDFSRSIYDPAWGKKTVWQSSPLDCLRTDLILEPYIKSVNIFRGFREYKWPKETDGSRYSCATNLNSKTEYFNLDPTPETNENIFKTLLSCQGNGNVTLLDQDSSEIAKCTSDWAGWTYKLVPSLIRHVSPDTETYGKQLTSLATPNLPVDENRYIAYLGRDLKEKRFDYPNVFDIQIPLGSTDDEIKTKIRQYLTIFDEKMLSQRDSWDLWVFQVLIPKNGTKNSISLAQIVASSPDLENNLIASLRWKNLPTTMKYQQGIVDALRGNKTERVGIFWNSDRKYEISYLGGQGDAKNFIIWYQPNLSEEYPSWYQTIIDNQSDYQEEQQNVSFTQSVTQDTFTISQDEYDELLGVDSEAEEASSDTESDSDSKSCNYDNAVVIWEWLSAIQCWLSDLFDTEWEPWESEYSFDWDPYLSLTLGNHTLYSSSDLGGVSLPQSDTNSNGVTDTIENNSNSFSLRNLPSEYILSPKWSITLTTSLEQGTSLVHDNISQIQLVILRIANLDTGVQYTSTHPDWEKIQKESFAIDWSPIFRNGQAKWKIRSLTNARMSVEIETRIKSGDKIYVQSWKTTLSPESLFPQFTLLSSEWSLTPNTVRADDKNGVNLLFQSDDVPLTVDVEIVEYITNRVILPRSSFPVSQKTLRLGSPTIDPVLHKSGKYILTLTHNWVSDKVHLFVVAWEPEKIITNMPKILLAHEKYILDFSVTDSWWNVIDTHSWKGEVRTSQPVIFSNNTQASQNQSFSLANKVQFQPLREGTITLDFTAKKDQKTLLRSIIVPVLDDIKIETQIDHSWVIKVWQKLPIEFTIKTKNGSVITDWNMPIRIANKGTGAYLDNSLVTFVNWKGKAVFNTGTQSGTTSFYLAETLANTKIGTNVEIAPDVPHRLTFSGPDTLLSKKGHSQILAVNIYDKYGNYIHPSTVDVRVEGDNEELLEPLGKIWKIEGDIYGVRLVSRGYPWRVLIRGAVWENNKKSIQPTLENVWEVNILPVITSADIVKNTWNALSHVLLWGPFGQFVTSGYFAGGLLFSPNTQALSVSTLVDSPRSWIFSVSNTGALNLLGNFHLGTWLQVAWQPDSWGLFALLVSDKRLGPVARIVYPQLAQNDDILFSPSDNDVKLVDGIIVYKWIPLSSVENIFNVPIFTFQFLSSASDVRLNVIYNNKIIGGLILKYSSRTPIVSWINPHTFSIEMLMSDIITDRIWWTFSSSEKHGIMILESSSTTSFVWWPVDEGYSAYPDKYGMGWTWKNLWLLEFASGEKWSNSQQSYNDYVTIQLWDPLVSLPEYRVDPSTWFDSTIGTPVYFGSDTLENFELNDINNDQQQDIIVTDSTKTLSVSLSKKDGEYIDVGEFLSLENARDNTIRTGDFFADGYVDAVYVDDNGILRLISHDWITSQEIQLDSDRNRDIWQVTQMEVFDMDHDKHDDIVILDTIWQLSIFYGSAQQKFRYQFVDHVFDFAFTEKSLFSGAISYEYPGFSFSDTTQSKDLILQLQREQLQSILFTSITLPDVSNQVSKTNTPALFGTQMSTSFDVDKNAGAGMSLANLNQEYTNLAHQYGSSLEITQQNNATKIFSLLKAPFVDTNTLSVSKKYISLEKNGIIMSGSLVQGTIFVKNVSSKTLSKLIIAENFPSYLEKNITSYTLKQWTRVSERKFVDYSDWWVADLRDISINPGETIEIVYSAQFSTFSFGTFDVWYLEDKNDPLMNVDVLKEKILTINPSVMGMSMIPEKDFYNTDRFGDIRINPNNTCGGPLFLWRSHNVFDRTYQKTLIVRNIENPDEIAMSISNDPIKSSSDLTSSNSQSILSTLSSDSSSESLKDITDQYSSTAQSELDTFHHDSDGDEIPDRYDEDSWDVFSIENTWNTSQVTVTLGKLDDTIDEAIEGVETFISGLSCGFGDAGCIAQPMNWTVNVPWNTITVLGYAVPGINQAPIACYKDVRCGVPIFAYPTDCCRSTSYTDLLLCAVLTAMWSSTNVCMWPSAYGGAGWAFDSSTSVSVSSGDTTFTWGEGISQYRMFMGATLTGALAEVFCFWYNDTSNPVINLPWLFPIAFQGNCIYATQPLTQCSDDGSDDVVLELETDEVELDEESDSDNEGIQITNSDSCGYFTPVTSYPKTLIDAVNRYLTSPTLQNLELLRTQLSENASLVTWSYASDQSLIFTTSSPYESIQETTPNDVISYPESWNGVIKVTLDSSSFSGAGFGPIFDVQLKSISAFPQFIMDWYHRQLDEIVSSLSSLPDIKIFLPNLGSWFSDAGWISEFNTSNNWLPAANTVSSWTNSADILTPLDVATDTRDTLVAGVQGGIWWIQAAFEYLSLLPMVDVHPEVISLDLPWMDRSALQSWIYRNEAILAQWEALPQNALWNAVDAGGLISSIRSNIETVRTYMTLPEQLQNLFYIKEKFLYEILKNVHAIQQLMGGWLYDNGERFKTWVETFILITKLWDLWQILIDIFDDYEESCAVCHNEQWNLQEWLWIIISAVIPPIPVIKMPRWPDIELDFSDLDIGIDIAYPVFNFSFYPLELPDMPSPNFSGLTLPTIPQLPPLPDLNLDFEIPAINLPKLPNLPPAPIIPELSQAISIVLKIFKIVTLIQCLYRKVPLSPEWYVGTKIAHKTDRQWYLPIDFLNVQIPSVVIKWIDAIRVSTHVELTYDVDYIIEMIQSALEPLEDFPRDLSEYTWDLPSSVDINLDAEEGSTVQTSALNTLPWLIGQLYEQTMNPKNADTSHELQALDQILADTNMVKSVWASPYQTFDPWIYHKKFQDRATIISQAIQEDIDSNKKFITDLSDIVSWKKKPQDIAWLQEMDPNVSHLASSSWKRLFDSSLINISNAFKNIPALPEKNVFEVPKTALLATSVTPVTTQGKTQTSISPLSDVSTQKKNSTKISTSNGLYITKNGATTRLNYFYESQENDSIIHTMDDDWDGDVEIFYTLGNVIYRKENYTNQPQHFYIKDRPRIFTTSQMMKTFFGLDTTDIAFIPQDMQIFLRESHFPDEAQIQYVIHDKQDHQQFDIFSTWWQSDPKLAKYRIDSILSNENTVLNNQYSVLSQPILSRVSWWATLYRKKIYRTLYRDNKYREWGTDVLYDLPVDFVIRSKKYWYTKEKTTLQLVVWNQTQDIVLRPWDVLSFIQDSKIIIKSGSLILPSDDYEEKWLNRSDIYSPLFPEDIIKMSENGSASVRFPDWSRTDLYPRQTWSLFYHNGLQSDIQNLTLPVDAGWYYVVSRDAFSLAENRISRSTLFDAYTRSRDTQLIDTLPTTLNLNFDTPTEIDFAQYFPLETIKKVEVIGLSEAFWKQITATKISFQTWQKNQTMTLKVTNEQWVVFLYEISLVTDPAKIAIIHVDEQKTLTGSISAETKLPLTVQSFIDGKSWTLSTPVAVQDKKFTTSFLGISPEWSVLYADQKAFSIQRDTGSLATESGVTLVPEIKNWYPIVIKTLLNQKPVSQIVYQTQNLRFQQAASSDTLQKNTLGLMSTSLRLEPWSTRDEQLRGGAYIVDADYKPLLAFDTSWVVRYLDSDVSFSAQYEWGSLVLHLSRGRSEIGKLILKGDMLTVWDK